MLRFFSKYNLPARGFTVLEMTVALFLAGLILTITYWGFTPDKLLGHVNKKAVQKHVETVKYSAKTFFNHLHCLPVLKGNGSDIDDYALSDPRHRTYDKNKLDYMYKYPACAQTQTCKVYCAASEAKLKNEWSGPYIKGAVVTESLPGAGESAFSLKELVGDNFYGKYLIGFRESSSKKFNELYYYIYYFNSRAPLLNVEPLASRVDDKFVKLSPELCGTNTPFSKIPIIRYSDYFQENIPLDLVVDGEWSNQSANPPRLARKPGKIFGDALGEKCTLVTNNGTNGRESRILGVLIKILSHRIK